MLQYKLNITLCLCLAESTTLESCILTLTNAEYGWLVVSTV